MMEYPCPPFELMRYPPIGASSKSVNLFCSDDPGVLEYLPNVEMTRTVDSESSADSADGVEQAFSGSAKPAGGGDKTEYTVSGTLESSNKKTPGGQAEPKKVEGILLSHDTEYWYVFATKGTCDGKVLFIPVDEASDINVASSKPENKSKLENTSEIEQKSAVEAEPTVMWECT